MRVRSERDIARLPEGLRQAIRGALAAAPPNLERPARHAPAAKKAGARHATPCRVHFHSVRNRLADNDGLSGKACLDGLVLAGVLEDDSAAFVSSVTHTQERGDTEETIITLEWAE